MKAVRIGIIGLGMGGTHARHLLEGKVSRGVLAAVCDLNPEPLANFPETRHFSEPGAMLASGAVDAVVVATPHYSHPDLTIQVLNQGLHAMVGKPSAVRAWCRFGKRHRIEVEDEVTAYLEYPNGATGVFVTGTGEAPGVNRLEVAGDLGRITLDGDRFEWARNEVSAAEFLRASQDKFTAPPSHLETIAVEGPGGQHAGIMQNFVDAILDGVPLIAPGPEGLASVELANAMLLSSVRDRTVRLPLDAAEVKTMLDELIAAAVPAQRGPLGCRVMRAGKDYFTDKSPFTTLEQLAEARRAHAETGRKYMVYYGERLHSESGMFAGDLIAQGAIGRVLQVIGLGPHRLNAPSRPAWFFDKTQYGGILCDIGSHQCEQFLTYTGAVDGRVLSAREENFAHPEYPGLEDFGEASLIADNGASFYFHVDWFTPDGLATWGDGRTIILGTEGYMELRKYLDLGRETTKDHLYLVNGMETRHFPLEGQVGYRFFGELVRDCLERTERAMTQAHAFKAAELSMSAQAWADRARAS